MAEDIVQVIQNAREDAISLSQFIYYPATVTVNRRLAPPIHTLEYYLQYLEGLEKVYSQPTGTVEVNGEVVKTVRQSINDAIDSTILGDYQTTLEAELVQEVIRATNREDAIESDLEVEVVRATEAEAGISQDLSDLSLEVEAQKLDTGITVTDKFGGIARTQAAKNSDVVSIKDFGLVGDGITDETFKMQLAINASATNGFVLDCLSGNNFLVSSIELPNNTRLKMNDSSLYFDRVATASPSNREFLEITVASNCLIDNLNIKHTGGNRSNSYCVDVQGDYNVIGTISVLSVEQTNNSFINVTGNNNTIGKVKTVNVDRPLNIEGVTTTTTGNTVDKLDFKSYIRGVKIKNSKGYEIGEHFMSGRSPNVNPLAITPGHNGILLEGAPDGVIGNGVVEDAGEHAYRIGGESRIRTTNVKYGNLKAVRPRGCAFKTNPFGKNQGGVEDYVDGIFVNSIEGVDCGDGQLGELGKQPDIVRITSARNVTIVSASSYNVLHPQSGLGGIAVNDCSGITVGTANFKNLASQAFLIRGSQDVVAGDEGDVSGINIGKLSATLTNASNATGLTFDTTKTVSNVFIDNITITGFTARLIAFASAMQVGGFIMLSGRSYGNIAPVISSAPTSNNCILNWSHNGNSYVGKMLGYAFGAAKSQILMTQKLADDETASGLFINNTNNSADIGSRTGGVEFSRNGTTRRGAAIVGKHTSSNLNQMGLAFLIKNSTLGGSDALVEGVVLKHNGSLNLPLLPTSASGLVSGDIWNDAGTLKIV